MLQIDPEIVEKFEFFVVLMQFLLNFQDFPSKVPTQSTTKERAMHGFFERTLQRFASKTLQNDSKYLKKIQNRFYTTYVHFLNRFGIRKMINVQQRMKSYFCRLLKKYLQTSVEKKIKFDSRKLKMPKFLSIPGIFS